MTTMLRTLALACSAIMGGCLTPGQTQHYMVGEAEPLGMIQIQNVSLTDKTLTLEYQVSNPFEEDIRVCHAAWVYGNREVQHAITRIRDNTVRIILGNVDKELNARELRVTKNPRPIAKYIRLEPGEFYSGRVVLDLPIRDYSLEPEPRSTRPREENEDIILRHVVFEVGYFGPKLNKFFDTVPEMNNVEGIEPKLTLIGPFYYLATCPLIVDEMQDGQAREVMYAFTSWVANTGEESAAVVLTSDAAIPCSVPEDK